MNENVQSSDDLLYQFVDESSRDAKSVGTPTSLHELVLNQQRRAGNETPLLSWKQLIDVHQNFIFEKEKNRRRAHVTGNRCKLQSNR